MIYLVHLYSSRAPHLVKFEENKLLEFIQDSIFKQYKKGETFELKFGCYILDGN